MPILDALAKKVKGMKQSYEQPEGDSRSIREKSNMIDEYKKATSTAPVVESAKKFSPPSTMDKVNPAGKYGDKPGEKRIDVGPMVKPLGSLKKGGKIKKTGVYKLHKGEQVMPAKKAGSVLGGPAKHPAAGDMPDDVHIQRNVGDGSFSIRHSYSGKEPMQPEKRFSAKNSKHLLKHMRAAFNAPQEPDQDDVQ